MTHIGTTADIAPLAGLKDDWDAASKYLSMFIDEAQRTLDEITEVLLAIEAGDGGDVGRLLIAAHRLKGSAASIGLNRVAKLAHLMEDILQELADGGRSLPPEVGDFLLQFVDDLRKHVDAWRDGKTEPETDSLDALARALAAIGRERAIAAIQNNTSPSSATNSATENPSVGRSTLGIDAELHRQVAATVAEDQRDTTVVGVVAFEPNLPLVGLKARLVYEKLSNLGTVSHFDPPIEEVENREDLAAVRFGAVTEKSAETIRRLLRVGGVRHMTIEALDVATLATSHAPAAENVRKPRSKPAETLRVDVGRLDRLMNQAGELTLDRSRLTRIVGRLRDAVAGCHSAELLIAELQDALHMLHRTSRGIQQGAMAMRMVPIEPLLIRLHRVVRDIARAGGKDIRLAIRGEKTELDKRMIDELGDPLIHAIRNAADHGIESPDVRVAAGKPPYGTIAIDGCHRGGNVVLRISDDGRGIDVQRLRDKAVERGLIAPSAADRMNPSQILSLIWLPGLSTAEKISDLSGRGMGMDIVRSKIEELNGAVEVESEPGRGTTIRITLPLTLAILNGLMVDVRGEVFAVPMESVVEIIGVAPGDVATVRERRVAMIRGQVIPIVTLDNLFPGSRGPRGAAAAYDGGYFANPETLETTLVILGHEEQRVGLVVDRVFGKEEVVIRSLASNYRNVAGIAGASIFGDGRVALILDVPALIEMAGNRMSRTGIIDGRGSGEPASFPSQAVRVSSPAAQHGHV